MTFISLFKSEKLKAKYKSIAEAIGTNFIITFIFVYLLTMIKIGNKPSVMVAILFSNLARILWEYFQFKNLYPTKEVNLSDIFWGFIGSVMYYSQFIILTGAVK